MKYILEGHISSTIFFHFENEGYVEGGGNECINKSERSRSSFEKFQILSDALPRTPLTSQAWASWCDFVTSKHHQFSCSIAHIFGGEITRQYWSEDEARIVLQHAWILHRLAFSFDAPARILRAAPMSPFDAEWMELEACFGGEEDFLSHPLYVGFMTIPGFQLKTCILCQVYPTIAPPPRAAHVSEYNR